MKGVPARAIQELAGHRDLSTTQRYMDLNPSALGCDSTSGSPVNGYRFWRRRFQRPKN